MPKLRDPRVLIVALLGVQAVVLGAGLFGLVWWLHQDIRSAMRRQVLANNRAIARRAVGAIRQMELNSVEVGSAGWQRLQAYLEGVELPNRGFLCAVDSDDGRLVGHPRLQTEVSVGQPLPGQSHLHGSAARGQTRLYAAAKAAHETSGWVRLPDGTHLVAAQTLPELGVTVLAHQREAGIDAAVAPMIRRLWTHGGVAGGIVLLLSGGTTVMLVRRYEDRLMLANADLERRVEQRTQELTETRDAVIFGLAKLAESRDDDTGEHLERIGFYVEQLARELSHRVPELTETRIAQLRLASSLHDIGKVGVPDTVLLKAGALSEDERRVIEKHPIVGGDTLHAIRQRLHSPDDFLIPACEIAFAHHERWDGSGYPFGLAGEHIPLPARIVAVADVYDALTSDRVYRAALSHERARQIIVEGRGTHFDPQVVDAFLAQQEVFRLHTVRQHGARDSSTAPTEPAND